MLHFFLYIYPKEILILFHQSHQSLYTYFYVPIYLLIYQFTSLSGESESVYVYVNINHENFSEMNRTSRGLLHTQKGKKTKRKKKRVPVI